MQPAPPPPWPHHQVEQPHQTQARHDPSVLFQNYADSPNVPPVLYPPCPVTLFRLTLATLKEQYSSSDSFQGYEKHVKWNSVSGPYCPSGTTVISGQCGNTQDQYQSSDSFQGYANTSNEFYHYLIRISDF